MSRLIAPTLAGYRKSWLRADVVAGLSAGAVVIPQAMAYATIADMPVQIGLYTCMVPMVVYALLGGSRTTSVSTTSTIATLTASTLIGAGVAAGSDQAQSDLITLTLMVGVLLLLARVLRLGAIIENISEATLTGIKAGVGLTVAAGQLPKLLGVPPDNTATGFFQVLWSALKQIGDANGATILLAAGSIAVLYAMKKFVPRIPGPLVVVAAGILLVAFAGIDDHGVALISPVPHGIPLPALPSFEHAGSLVPGALAIAVMAFLETVSVGRGVRRPDEPQIDTNQELLANGVAATLGSFFHTLAPAGGFSQTAVNQGAGARTQLSSIVTAVLAVLVALFLAPVLDDLPQAALGAMVVVAVLGLINLREFKTLWQIDRIEFWVALVTALVGLAAGLLPAVAVGVIFTLYLVLRELDRAHIVQLHRNERGHWRPGGESDPTVAADPLVLRINSALYTANVRTTVRAIESRSGIGEDAESSRPRALVLDASRAYKVSTTVMHGIRDMLKELSDAGVTLYIVDLPESEKPKLRTTPWWREFGGRRYFDHIDDAVDAAENDCATAAKVQESSNE
ncbi:STAS domain-containing protein [Rhodococcus sp. D2-41]|uniref:SulP family inorganic anion transporter n=1 Tax=Speluncibacter jeojiensis TaxID=2710754 RepID=A0A9X4RF36_9ACTN|nr:SulP family inorganic anion transporter [Rhodococcus sp. D2-41]MDG3009485.1 STAS domain-containing protein [Rhodococcus sp. D2-41]MDG3016414.1 SulP family inorganic anion transporter [Corynebacteriales bacterium D3-21]